MVKDLEVSMRDVDRFGLLESRFNKSADNHAEDLRQKVEQIVRDFQPLQMFGDAKDAESIARKFDIFPSPVKHYRARCRFAIGEIDGTLHYLLYEHGEPSLIADYFPQACVGICRSGRI
jgi:tRNA/tmRNA/rRNA uracil-C5-methylase (TrmA/RlmC/RlmD family)